MRPAFPPPNEITLEWLRTPLGKGTFGAHEVLKWRHMNLPTSPFFKDVLDLRDEDGNSPMHLACLWQEAIDATPREFLTPEFMLIPNCKAETPILAGLWEWAEIPWDRFPPRRWAQYLPALTDFYWQTMADDDISRRRSRQSEKVEELIAKVEALKRLNDQRLTV